MIDPFESPGKDLDADQSFELLRDLEANKSEDVRQVRVHERVAIKSQLIVEPGNATDLRSFKVQGVTGDISPGGMQALLPVPLRVGDVYRLKFDRTQLDLPMTFARCLRCRLIREEAYESGFAFFAPVQLEGIAKQRGEAA